MIAYKFKITSKDQIDEITERIDSNMLKHFPDSYPCVLVLLEVDSKQGDYHDWHYVYPSDFEKESGTRIN